MKAIKSKFINYLESLRFPVLLIITALIFLINVVVPDAFPLIDELLMALVVALLARLKRRPTAPELNQDEGKEDRK